MEWLQSNRSPGREDGIPKEHFPLVFVLLVLLIGTGCRSDAEPSGDAQSRRSVDQETVTTLIKSQRALQQGALQASLVLADSVVRRAPRLADAHFQRGRALSEVKRFEEAEAAYRKVLELDPDYRGAWYNLGNNAFRQQYYEDAIRFYREEQALHPSAATLVALGWAYEGQDEIDRARSAYEQAIEADSTHAPAYARLGQLYEDEGELEEAFRHSRRALELAPDDVNYRYVVGAQRLRLDRLEEAVDDLEAVTEARPWHQGAHYNLGQALMRLGRQEEAERYLEAADSLDSMQREIERLQSIAENNPDEPEQWRTLGDELHRAGRLEEAKNAFGLALYLQPDNPTLRNRFAMLSAELEEYEAAVEQYRTLLRQHPTYVEGWFNLGVVYAWKGEPQQAEQAWERVLQQAPDHQQAKAYLAQIRGES